MVTLRLAPETPFRPLWVVSVARLAVGLAIAGLMLLLCARDALEVRTPSSAPLLEIPEAFRPPIEPAATKEPGQSADKHPTSSAQTWTLDRKRWASQPCSWGTRVFVVQTNHAGTALDLLCLDSSSTQPQWICPILRLPRDDHQGVSVEGTELFTPACDGRSVFVTYVAQNTLWLASIQLQGQRQWSVPVGPWTGPSGGTVSPVIDGPCVYLACDQASTTWGQWESTSFVAAVHRLTGQLVWRTSRPAGESQGVPVIESLAGRKQLVLAGPDAIRSYDPLGGEEIWRCDWRARSHRGQVLITGDSVVALSSGSVPELMRVRADGRGDVTKTHVVWQDQRVGENASAVLAAEPWILVVQRQGTVIAVDATSGRTAWRTRVTADLVSPPLLLDRRLICASRDGVLHWLDLDRRNEAVLETRAWTEDSLPPATRRFRSLLPCEQGLLLQSEKELIVVPAKASQVASAPQPGIFPTQR